MTRVGRRLLRALLLIAALGHSVPAAAQALDADAQDASRVVLQQLEAFRRDDFATAYTFASSDIREMYDRPRFEQMVRQGYPEIARSASATIDGSRRGPGGELFLLLRIRGTNGRGVEAVYEMVREGSSWRINGVVTRPDTSEAARLFEWGAPRWPPIPPKRSARPGKAVTRLVTPSTFGASRQCRDAPRYPQRSGRPGTAVTRLVYPGTQRAPAFSLSSMVAIVAPTAGTATGRTTTRGAS